MEKTLKKFYSFYQTDSQSRECASAYLSNSSISNVNDFDFETQGCNDSGVVFAKQFSVNDDLSGVDQLWMDWIPNQFAWPMFSEKLAKFILSQIEKAKDLGLYECD